MPLTKEEIKQIAIRAADEVIERAYSAKSTFNPHTPSGALSNPPAIELVGVARRPPTPEEALEWEEMKTKYHLPPYVEPALEISYNDNNTIVLEPAVNINLLSKLDKEVPNWESIKHPFPRS